MLTQNVCQQINADLAHRINQEARANPETSPYAGKFVGIANGQVVVVADSLSELGRQFDALPFDPAETFCIEASRDYDKVEQMWLRPDWLSEPAQTPAAG